MLIRRVCHLSTLQRMPAYQKKKKKRSPEPASAFNAEAALESENS
jgi:hypothetical protein